MSLPERDGAAPGATAERAPAERAKSPETQVSERRYVITFGCPDRTGIVARVSSFLADAGGWIVEAAYHTDPDTGWFFTRQEVRADSLPYDAEELRGRFADVATSLSAESNWRVDDTGVRRRAVILVSRE